MQLYHEDRKDAIVKLDELIKKSYRTYPQFRDTVNAFTQRTRLLRGIREDLSHFVR